MFLRTDIRMDPITVRINMNRMNLDEPVQTFSDWKTKSKLYCTISHELRGRNERVYCTEQNPLRFLAF